MRKIIVLLFAICLLTSCETDDSVPFLSIPDDDVQLVEMDIETGLSTHTLFTPIIYASQMVVDWGDGSQPWEYVNADTINSGTDLLKPLKYTYASSGNYSVNIRAVKITRLDISLDSVRQMVKSLRLTDCRHLKALSCKGQPLKSVNIDVSGIKALEFTTLPALESFSVSGCDSLSVIALSQNPLLNTINLVDNRQLSALALNAMFGQLPQAASDTCVVILSNNAGDASCDKSIATQKGWTVKIE